MSGSTTEFEPLHKEHPAKGKVNLAYSHKPSAARSFVFNFFRVLGSYISLLCAVYPTPCAILLFAFIGLALFGLGEAIFNPRVKYGYVVHDHSNLKSIYDFKLNNVDHWCLRGDNDSCRCEDPFQPISRAEHNSWKVAFKTNRKIVKALEDDPTSDIDVAFVGESVVEEMDGRWMGVSRGGNFKTLKQIFDANFNKKKGASLNAVALGIAGDTAPNVLFRLLHGEMSQKLHPKIYWLSLGMNDLSRMQCSEEVVVLGILRVVEEIINNTNSYVVINSLFPMSEMRGAAYPMLHDMNEAFVQKTNVRGFRNRGGGSTYNPALVAPQAAQAPIDNNHPNGRRRLQYRQPQQYPPQQYPPQQYPPQQYPPQQYPPQQYQQYPQQYPQQQYQYPPPQQGYPPQQYPPQQYPPQQYAPQQGYQRQPMRPPTDSELEQQAEKEEQAREEEWKRHHHQRLFHQNQVNTNLVEQHRIRKHWSDRKLPLWSSITAINRELKKYVAHHQEQERVFFFDSTPIFATRQDQKHFALRLETISPKGHPTEFGFKSWEKAVAARAETLVQLWKDNHPTYTPPPSGADPFDMDSLLDNIPHMEDDIIDDLNFFKNIDDAWMDRLGEDDEVGGDDDVEDDEYNDDEYNDDAESGDDDEEPGDDDEEPGDDGGEESNDEESEGGGGSDDEESEGGGGSDDEESEDGGDDDEEVEEESEDGADDENDTDDDTPEVETKQTVVEPKVAPKTIDPTTTRGKTTKTSAHKTHKAPATKTKTTPKKKTAKKPNNTP